jgi:hypothetical protein
MLSLDHIAIACESLDAGQLWVEDRLGAPLQPGGKHARFGTHNLLMGLEDGIYLELIAIDPEAPDPGRRRWFDLDDFSGAPRLTNWICATRDLADATALAPGRMGAAFEAQRGDLRWRFVGGEDGRLPFGGGFPALIDWGDSPHPSTRLPASGLRLERLEIVNPEADALRRALSPMLADARVVIELGAPAMRAVFSSSDGQRVLT